MNASAGGTHFHGNSIIGIQNTGGTIHNVQVNQQGAHAGPKTATQQAADIVETLTRRIEEARLRGELPADDADDAIAILTGKQIDAATEESRSGLVRFLQRVSGIVGGSAAAVKAVAEATDAIKAIGQ
ncbi:hypothetical protein [Glycomyces rhizosphaerae]|uniref:Uncharacterized protein n=1 Tax=Glycomyces rhizosphaerae TaxID=2054422 RepID=A0ABV7Q0T1_9ACTN